MGILCWWIENRMIYAGYKYYLHFATGVLMKTYYYLGWFRNFFPENLRKVLKEDIIDRKSIVMISSNPSLYEDNGATERSCLDQAGIKFYEYHLINYRV